MIHIDIDKPDKDTVVEVNGTTRVRCERAWVALDPYDQDGIAIHEEDGDIVIYHVSHAGQSHVYTVQIQDP